MQKHGIPHRDFYNSNTEQLNWSSNHTGVSEKELFDKATYSIKDVFGKVYIRLFKATDEGQQALTMDLQEGFDQLDASFVEQRHRAFGKCYTLYPAKWIREHGIYYYKINL